MTHWRSTIVDAPRDGLNPAVVVADLDLVNMFVNAEWPNMEDQRSARCARGRNTNVRE